MKKFFTVMIVMCAACYAKGQDGLNLDFSDPSQADRFNFIVDSGGEVIEKSVANGELKVVLNKQEWHFFQIWADPLDFITSPSVSFRIKAEQDTPMRIWLKQADGTELTIFEETVEQGPDYQAFNFRLSSVSPLTTDIQEVGIDIGGYQVPPATFAGTVYFDEFKLGAAAAANASYELDFSEVSQADALNFITDTGGEITKTVTDGVVQLALNKKEWHFIQIWIDPLDFVRNPYLRVVLRAEQPTPIRIWITQQGGGVTKDLYNDVLSPSANFQTIQISLEDVLPLTGYVQELNLDIGGYQVPPAVFSGNVFIDDIKIGESAKSLQEVYGSSYQENFSDTIYNGWMSGEGFNLSLENDALKVDVNRETPVTDGELSRLASLSFEGKVLDISAKPYFNVDVKATEPFEFSIIAVDNSNQRKELSARVVKVDNYQKISLDLSTVTGLDLSKIERFYFGFNRAGFAFNAMVWLDNISIGDAADNLARMDAIPDKAYYKNTGTKEILLTHIHNASSITVDSLPSLIENIAVSSISNGTAKLNFNLKQNATSKEAIEITLNGATGYSPNHYTFDLTVEDNLGPTLDSIADIIAEVNKPFKIKLTGISDGNATVDQPLTFKVTSSSPLVMSGKVTYGEGPYAMLHLLPLKKGAATVTVTVKDNGDVNNTTAISFKANVYKDLNSAPTVDSLDDVDAYQDAGPSSITLTGIDDGDKNAEQSLTVTAANSNPAIVNDVRVDFQPGSNDAILYYTPVADTTGTTTITVTIADNGANNNNQGNASIEMSFNIHVLRRPVTGYVATLSKAVEGFSGNEKYAITEVDSGGFKALVFTATDKFYWDGVTMNLPEELDLSENPYLTMEVFPIGENTLHWLWFYDVNGIRNDLNNIAKAKNATAGQWNKLVFDFSGANDWINGEINAPINNKRINRILFDMHNAPFTWPPPPNYTGTFIIRNIRIGSEADYQAVPEVTIKPVGDQVNFTSVTNQKVALSGISNGHGSVNGVTLTITNSNESVVINPHLSEVSTEGIATLIYNTGPVRGSSTVTITAEASGATAAQISFDIKTLSDSSTAASTVSINLKERHQRMYGFGAFSIDNANIDFYTKEMGGTVMRVGIISNQFEPLNDNDDPNVINLEGFNYDAFDWNALKELKSKGVEHFILTSWSPPAWMKTNLSVDYYTAGYTKDTDNTDNRLDYSMYEEFAESVVAVVKAFKQRAGINLLAIGLQNEPAFHEPYPSAILGPDRFVEMIKVAGRRFQAEGLDTRFYMAEQVSNFVEDNTHYLDAVQADAEANQYCDIFAIHGYGSDGITPGQPNFTEWENYRNNAAEGEYPKEVWMTETHKDYVSWDDGLSIAGAIYGALEHGNVSWWTQWAFEGPFVSQGRPTGMLYAMSNFAKFIKPGDVRVTTTSAHNDVLATTFINEWTGKTAVVLINKGDVPLSVKLEGPGVSPVWLGHNTAENRNLEKINSIKNGVALLPAKSVTTLLGISFVWGNLLAEENDSTSVDAGNAAGRIYPNPSDGKFYLSDNDVSKVEITDFTGVTRRSINLKEGERSVTVEGLQSGIYLITAHLRNGETKQERFVID
jgi:O-glycosyl hydrolase